MARGDRPEGGCVLQSRVMGILRLLWRALRQLFHEATGALFLCFGAFGGLAALREWHNPGTRWISWLGIGYAVMMAGFGIGAFRDSRRVR